VSIDGDIRYIQLAGACGAGYYGGGGAGGLFGGGSSTGGGGGGYNGPGAGGTDTVTFISGTNGQSGGLGFGGNAGVGNTQGLGGNLSTAQQGGTGGGYCCFGAMLGANGGNIPTGSTTGGNVTLSGFSVAVNGTISGQVSLLGGNLATSNYGSQSIFGHNVTLNSASTFFPGTLTATNGTTINLPSGSSAGGIIDSTSAIDLSTLTSLTFHGQNLAIVSSSNITSSSAVTIDLSNTTGGNGGNLTLIAGFTAPGTNLTPALGTFTIGAAGTGQLNIPNVTTAATTAGCVDIALHINITGGRQCNGSAITTGAPRVIAAASIAAGSATTKGAQVAGCDA
jgi:hypothetical protein